MAVLLALGLVTGARAQVFNDESLIVYDKQNSYLRFRFDCSLMSSALNRVYPWGTGGILAYRNQAQWLTGANHFTDLLTVRDSTFKIYDNNDTTKVVQFQVSGVSTGTTRTDSLPDASGTVTLNLATQILKNKSVDLGSNTLTSTLAQLNTAVTDANVLSVAGVESPTNKTFDATSNAPFLVDSLDRSGLVADLSEIPWTAALAAGFYRLDYYARVTTTGGVGTSVLQVQYDDPSTDDLAFSTTGTNGTISALSAASVISGSASFYVKSGGTVDLYLARPGTATYRAHARLVRLW